MTLLHEDMSPLEQALKNALHHEAAPENLAAKVLARLAEQNSTPKAQPRPWFSFVFQPIVRWAAFAAVAICLIAGGIHYRNLQIERAKGRAAKQQLMLALRIASSKLQLAKERVNEINTRPASQTGPKVPRSRS